MTYEEYALRVAWWFEEIVFFILPLIISHFVFGIGSRGYLITMVLARAVFHLLHAGAIASPSLKRHLVPLSVAAFGGMVAARVL